tara:strand:- start:10 stop:318 length:309 start_codon:yes stop_codon:yes gene_type:complete
MKNLFLALLLSLSASVALAKDLVIVGATWCPACVKLKNFIDNNTSRIKFDVLNVDIDKDRETADRLKVTKVPTSFIFDDDGKLLSKKIGYDSSYYQWLKDNE